MVDDDVGFDAVVLDVATGRREVARRRDLQRALIGKRIDALHDALAERARADERREVVVLQRAGGDLGGARRVFVHEHDERTKAVDSIADCLVGWFAVRRGESSKRSFPAG